MRTALVPLLALSCGWLPASAQPPQPQKGPPPIVIAPQAGGTAAPQNRPGMIVIRPGAQPVPANPAANPGVPTLTTPGVVPAQPANPAPAAEAKDGTVLYDYWFAAAVDGQRIGYQHWVGREVTKNGTKLWEGIKDLNLTFSRFGQTVSIWGEESTVETPEGEVLVTSMRQALGKDQSLALTGVVKGNVLEVRGEGAAAQAANTVPWPAGVVGIAREPRLFKEKALKPGESFDYLMYAAQLNRVVKFTTTLEAEETTVLWQGIPARRLVRFVTKMEPVGNFRLPPATVWCDAISLEPLRVDVDYPGFGGRLTFLRTTKEAATKPITRPVDVVSTQSIPLARSVPGMHTRESAVYKVSIPKDEEPGGVFPSDGRQEVKNLDAQAKTLELHVSASHGPARGAAPQPAPGPEFLGSSYFINWDNDLVKAHARRAVGGLPAGTSEWEKARAVERWVNQNMKAIEFSQALATADNVAKTLSGDCTEFAMLAAAMCRAVGVPSRTAVGLIYATDHKTGKPMLAFHMWYEVFAEGQWLPLDATLGQGGVGPGHLKITDHSWHEEKSFAPLLPVLRVLMAKPAVEVLRVSP